MKYACLAFLATLAAQNALAAESSRLVEPQLRLVKAKEPAARVALTFDACSGSVDHRILDGLVANRIPATIFVTGRWLAKNADAVKILQDHPDLFEVEDHGLNHIPAVDLPVKVYGIPAAGSADAVRREIAGGAQAMLAAGFSQPHWFRGATAKYTSSAIAIARNSGFKVAGFSINADVGASLLPDQTEKRIAAAHDGDVIIAHINQPNHASGAGVIRGILDLQQKHVHFVRLSEAHSEGSDGTTQDQPSLAPAG
jgi:peptidoglycan/xylan/chitin deacetylase (PgdA/CDA1 family)